jgi:hypothetical protein
MTFQIASALGLSCTFNALPLFFFLTVLSAGGGYCEPPLQYMVYDGYDCDHVTIAAFLLFCAWGPGPLLGFVQLLAAFRAVLYILYTVHTLCRLKEV